MTVLWRVEALDPEDGSIVAFTLSGETDGRINLTLTVDDDDGVGMHVSRRGAQLLRHALLGHLVDTSAEVAS